jgi:RNA polymerase sigma-70 factor (ECF subfamily)
MNPVRHLDDVSLLPQPITHQSVARDTDPDRDVVALMNLGDATAALRQLMQRHGAAVYRYCRAALNDATLAEDVQQQVFLHAFRSLPGFRGQSRLRTWLFGIARHRVLDAAKARRRRRATWVEIESAIDVVDDRPSLEEQFHDAQLHQVLTACLAELDEAARTALLLRYQQGFSFEEMAKICGERPGTLQARVSRTLPLLRKWVAEQLGPQK